MHEPEEATTRCYLPYPAYNDDKFIELLREEHDVAIGRIQKKGLTPTEIGLISTIAVLVIGPEWAIQYETRIRPQIIRAIALIRSKLTLHNIEADLCQTIRVPNVGDVDLILIPDRRGTPSGQDVDAIDHAVHSAVAFVTRHDRRDIKRIRSVFYPGKNRYEIINVEYSNGSDLNIAP